MSRRRKRNGVSLQKGMEKLSDKRERILAMAWALAIYYSQKCYAVAREVGLPFHVEDKGFWSKQRADFIAVNKQEEVVIVETKSCWSDFSSDKKWHKYLPSCDKFYFGADTETAKRIVESLDSRSDTKAVGVIAFEPCGEYLRMKFLRPARKHTRETPIFYLLWQMAARGFDIDQWKFSHGDIPRRIFEHEKAKEK